MVEKILGESKENNKWQIVSYGKSKQLPKTIANANSSRPRKHEPIKTSSPNAAAIQATRSAIVLQNNQNRQRGEAKVNCEKVVHLPLHRHESQSHHQPFTYQSLQKDLKKSFKSVQPQSQPHPQQLQQHHRKRSKLQQQIKRAHRHLLTSCGIDKQQTPKSGNSNALIPTTHSVSRNTAQCCQTSRNSCHLSLKKGTGTHKLKNSKNTKEIHSNNKNNNKLPRNSNSQQQLKGKASKSSKQKKLKSFVSDQDSIISSRWCSIEEQLDLLDKLLYYCDEEENAALRAWYNSIDKEFLFDSDSSEDKQRDDEGNQEGISDSDWSWSDMMSSSSLTSTTTAAPSEDDARSTVSNNNSMSSSCSSSLTPSSLKRRGHQHHPRFSGTRRPNVPPNVQEILAALYKNSETESASQLPTLADVEVPFDDSLVNYPDEPEDDPEMAQRIKASLNLPLTDSVTTSMGSNSPTPTDDSSMLDEGIIQTSTSASSSAIQPLKEKKSRTKRDKAEKGSGDASKEKKSKRSKKDKTKRASACLDSMGDVTAATSISDVASAATDEGIAIDDDDLQSAEWANLRCTSEAAEIVAEREARRNKNRCADYPGLAFGRSIFSSDTMMKFNIIRNELHNIMNTQLKRVINEI